MHQYSTTSVESHVYEEILDTIRLILKRHFSHVTPMYVNPRDKQQLFGWHLLLSKDEENADYFVLYETELFDSVAQVRFLHGEYQLQYTLEPNNVILLSQFRLDIEDEDEEWAEDNFKNNVINMSQPITDTEAKGLLLRLKALTQSDL